LTFCAYKRRFISMKSERLFIRVSKKEKAAMKKAAKELNVSLTAFVLAVDHYQINEEHKCTATPAKKD